MEILIQSAIELGMFAGKALVVLAVVGGIALVLAAVALRARGGRESLELENLNHKFDNFADALKTQLLGKKALKADQKDKKKKSKSAPEKDRPRLFVLDFEGDIAASQVDSLRDEVTAVLSVAQPRDEILVRLESPGGRVHGYGLAAAQLERIKSYGIPLTVAVDRVAASGGYMMACVGKKIIAAPFAIVGSVGVIAQVPNLHRLLKKYDIDYEEYTAGEFKRTVSYLGEISPKGRQKFMEQLEDTHQLFKEFIRRQRPQVNVDQISTGEYWMGIQAKDLKLVDEISTSDEYLFQRRAEMQIYRVKVRMKKSLSDKLSEAVSMSVHKIWNRLAQ